MGTGAQFVVPVARWSAWPPAHPLASDAPNVAFVDASLRRRLGPLARTTLHVAHECMCDAAPLRLVFASRHGELRYTVALLRALAGAEQLSPTLFSLSVHNGSAALFSIIRGDSSPATAIAAGAETLGQALLEAYCQFTAEPGTPVLVVYGDEVLPEEYREFDTRDAQPQPRALALLLSDKALRYTKVLTEATGEAASSREAQAESFVRHLADGAPGCWVGAGTTWSWQ